MKLNRLTKRLCLAALLCIQIAAVKAKSPTKPTASNKANATAGAEQPSLPPLEQPLITLDGIAITSQDYLNFMQVNPAVLSMAASSEIGKAEALREMLRTYILRKAMYDQGLLDKADKEPKPTAIAAAYEKLAKQHFPAPPAPDEKAAYDYYSKHAEKYGIPGNYRFNQILFKTPTRPDPAVLAAARERAEAAMKRLAAGEPFSAVATALTENTVGKVAGGDIGFIDPAQQPWIQEPLKTMKIGDRMGPIESPEGVVILELTDTRPPLIAPYANVRDKVMKDIRDEAQKKVRDAYVLELAKQSKIEVVAPSIKPLFPNGVLP